MTPTPTIDRSKVKALMQQEQQRFAEAHPRSLELYRRAQNSLLAGVPMHWMTRWPGGFPLFVDEARGATFRDVDGLEHVLTEAAYRHMIALGEQLEAEVRGVMERYHLPWHVTRVGCRVEYLFRPNPAQNGSEALAGQDPDLDPFIHLFMLNRGILLTPFHNMALIAQVRRHTEVFEEAVRALIS